jgi:hypothetical protein
MVVNRRLVPSDIPDSVFRKVLAEGHSINSATRVLKISAGRLVNYLRIYKPNFHLAFAINGRIRQANNGAYKLAYLDGKLRGEMNHT